MTKILLIQDTDWIERGPHQQHHIFERLSRENHDIHVVDFELLWASKKRKGIIKKGRVIRDYTKVVHDARIVLHRPTLVQVPLLDKMTIPIFHSMEILDIILKEKVDLVIGYTILNTLCGLFFAKLFRKPFIYHLIDSIHALSADYLPKPFHFITKLFEKAIINLSDKVITVNKSLRDYAINLGAKPGRVITIPTGVDVQKYKDSSKREETRARLGIGKSDTVMFFMGWLYQFSGLKDLADHVANRGETGLKLLIVGDGDLLDYLRTLSARSASIITTGRVPYNDIPGYLAAADVCVLPTEQNNIMAHIVPIKIQEYMAAGKPVVATPIPGIVREFGHDLGIQYSDNMTELVVIVERMIAANSFETLGRKNAQYMENHDWNDIVNRFQQEISKLTEKKRK